MPPPMRNARQPRADRDPSGGYPHPARPAEHPARPGPPRCLIFCDDLSFEREDADYKALKSVLDGGIEGRPANVLFYATSNRRHLMSRDMIENERSTAINPNEAVEEKVSLSATASACGSASTTATRTTYFAMVEGYAAALRHADRGGGAARAGERVVGDARRAVRARGLAVHPGPGRAARGESSHLTAASSE